MKRVRIRGRKRGLPRLLNLAKEETGDIGQGGYFTMSHRLKQKSHAVLSEDSRFVQQEEDEEDNRLMDEVHPKRMASHKTDWPADFVKAAVVLGKSLPRRVKGVAHSGTRKEESNPGKERHVIE